MGSGGGGKGLPPMPPMPALPQQESSFQGTPGDLPEWVKVFLSRPAPPAPSMSNLAAAQWAESPWLFGHSQGPRPGTTWFTRTSPWISPTADAQYTGFPNLFGFPYPAPPEFSAPINPATNPIKKSKPPGDEGTENKRVR